MKTYFDEPTQVKFYDYDNDRYLGGIAYHDEIICGECGGIVEISDLFDDAPDGVEPIHIYDCWVDINEAIIGD